ncbi:MAG: hypothetical protein HYR55_17235 [Acidobacteria bacterium]|nr:hypothetical protein [Acidobacteriota bacterium]MBI3657777.1 hypothetical protein [Acidobacteriota bacterium]
MDPIVSFIMFLILIICLAVWAVVGFLFWIPLLARAVTIFSAAVVYARVTGQDPESMQDYLRAASSFWFDGFVAAKKALFPTGNSSASHDLDIKSGRLFGELTWTLLFWLLALWLWNGPAAERLLVVLGARAAQVAAGAAAWVSGLAAVWQVLLAATIAIVFFIIGWMTGFAAGEKFVRDENATARLTLTSANPTVSISYDLNQPATVTTKVINMDTQQVLRTITQANVPAGRNLAIWNGRDDADTLVSNGDYRMAIQASDAAGNCSIQRNFVVRVFY